MKTRKMSFFISALVVLLAFSCEQGDLTDDDYDPTGDVFLKSLTSDSLIQVVPDIVIEDKVLQEYAEISQYHEDYITYTYDRYGRLFCINYFKRNSGIASNSSDAAQRYVYMQDRFMYNAAGRLSELLRYSRTYSTQMTYVTVRKSYAYNGAGQLSEIGTQWLSGTGERERIEYLYYDQLGNMVKRVVRDPDGKPYAIKYTYDRSDRLIRIEGYHDESSALRFVCELYYDARNNISRKEFYYPSPLAVSVADVVRKWVVHYKYDADINPFRDLNLPVSSLFEWMDLISPGNVSAIIFNNGSTNRAVFYKYRYNDFGYPILRLRVNALPLTDAVE